MMVDTYFRIAYPLTIVKVRGIGNGQNKAKEAIKGYGN